MVQSSGGIVHAVSGAARACGVQPGDRLLTVDGHRLRDVIDFWFHADGEEATVLLMRGPTETVLRLQRPVGSPWGIEFAEPLFDGLRRCTNHCVFCFLDQLPPGWRRTLYLRDDDFRLSFLYGNFATLSNLRPEDWARLEEQRLSPLYVSVHATDPNLRGTLLGRRGLPDIRDQLLRLEDLGIEVHAQVVLCPGLNDGAALERTVCDLVERASSVRSLSLVPVGLTRFRQCPPAGLEGAVASLRSVTPAEARDLLRWARPHQRAFRQRWGCTWLYPSDELYLLAGQRVPTASRYDGFPQLENGVGMVRRLLDDWARVRRRIRLSAPRLRSMTLVCGTLVAPLLRRMAEELCRLVGERVAEVVAVGNETFGHAVTVSGLLTGEDLRRALLGRPLGEIVFLPRAAFDEEGRTLDGLGVEQLEEDLQRPICLVERMGQVLARAP